MLFQIRKLDQGWAELWISHGSQEGTILASYLRDSPAELLSGLVRLLRGSSEERVLFEGEPGLTVMRLRRLPGDLARIEVSGGPSEDDDPEDPPWFRHTEPLTRFATRVHSEFGRLLRELGPDGYQRGWGMYGFPQRPFDDLGRLIAL